MSRNSAEIVGQDNILLHKLMQFPHRLPVQLLVEIFLGMRHQGADIGDFHEVLT